MRDWIEQYTTEDKTGWGEGPWQSEPDKVVWVDDKTRLDCMAHRNHSGAWCGYVGVPAGHRAFGRHYDDVPAVVHGGLTYSDYCQQGPPEHGICHIPQPGRAASVWWLGFDCVHFMDHMPAMAARLKELRAPDPPWQTWREEYRDLDFVVSEVEQLAAQVAALN